MKKFMVLLVSVCILFSFTACNNNTAQEGKSFKISIINQTDSEIYGIENEYFISGISVGSGNCINANSEKISKGDEITFEYLPKDFSEDADLKEFSVVFSVMKNISENSEYNCAPLKISAEYSKTYEYVLEGSFEDGFTLTEK